MLKSCILFRLYMEELVWEGERGLRWRGGMTWYREKEKEGEEEGEEEKEEEKDDSVEEEGEEEDKKEGEKEAKEKLLTKKGKEKKRETKRWREENMIISTLSILFPRRMRRFAEEEDMNERKVFLTNKTSLYTGIHVYIYIFDRYYE